MNKYDYLIVGCGLSGATLAERLATKLNKKILIIDSRNHIAGNCYDEFNNNEMVHKYGPHLFHTNNKEIFDYLGNFTEWTEYFHKVTGYIDGKFVPLPFNFNTMNDLFPKRLANLYEDKLLKTFAYGSQVSILKLMETSDEDLNKLVEYVYQKVFLGYTVKMWDQKPEELDASVTSRVPIRLSRDNNYFTDKYQCLPKLGYTEMVKNMIFEKNNIDVRLNCSYYDLLKINDISYDKIIWTGAIDQFFEYKYGKLPYRSIDFKFGTSDVSFEDAGTHNYPNNFDYTRETSFGRIQSNACNKLTVKEFPTDYELGKNDPYYPILNSSNKDLYLLYKNEAKMIENRVIFTGRLGSYQYYDMHMIVGQSLKLFHDIALGNS